VRYPLDAMASLALVVEGVAHPSLAVGAHVDGIAVVIIIVVIVIIATARTTKIGTDKMEGIGCFVLLAQSALQWLFRNDYFRPSTFTVVLLSGANGLDVAIASGTLPDSQWRSRA